MSGNGSESSPIDIALLALTEIYAHSRDDYPREACGMIIGPRGAPTAEEVRRCRNLQDELHAKDPVHYPRDGSNGYTFEPAELLYLEKSLRSDRPVKIIYHSHVDAGAYFSRLDKEVALAGWDEPAYPVMHLVVDAQPGKVVEARLFDWSASVADFVEVARFPGDGAARERG